MGILRDAGVITVNDDGKVRWNADWYGKGVMSDVKDFAEKGKLYADGYGLYICEEDSD